jgi:hypothetical protein
LLFGTWADGGPGERLGGQAPGAAEVSQQLVKAWSAFMRGASPGWEVVGAADVDRIGVFGGRNPFEVEVDLTRAQRAQSVLDRV